MSTFLVGAASADFSFAGGVNVGVGAEPSGLAYGDFDGDGDLDLATTVENPDRVAFLLNGGGVFAPGGSANLPNSASPEDLVAGDFDGDGAVDLMVSLKDTNSVVLVRNLGGMSFALGGSTGAGAEPRGMEAADLDNDGDLDVAVSNRESDTATVMRNDGTGVFSAQTLATGAEPRDVAFGDFDGDGDLDLAVSGHEDRSVRTYRNTGGTYASWQTLSVGSQRRPEDVVAADLDNDGDVDLAAASNGQNGALNDASVFLNAGDGAFTAPAHYPTGGQDTSGLLAADLDCDGLVDLIARNESSANVSVLPNLGGIFGGATLVGAGAEPDDHVAADFDGDGDRDLAVANDTSNNVTIVMNESCAAAGGPATLVDATVTRGTLIAGGVGELAASDDAALRTRSERGFTAQEPNVAEVVVGATTDLIAASTLGLSIESRVNNPGTTAKIGLKNWTGGHFEQVATYSVGLTDAVESIPGLNAANRVRNDGRIELSMKHTVVATFSAIGFDSQFDHVVIDVQ